MKTWSKSDLIGLFFIIFGIICIFFSTSSFLCTSSLLLSSIIFLHCVYNSRYDLLRYRNILCHYQAVLTSSQDGWIAWNMNNEYIGSSKKLRNFFNIKNTSEVFIDNILCSIDKKNSEELSFHFNKLKKTGMSFKITVTTLNNNQIEIVGSRMTVNNIETILLWCSDITRSSSMMASIEKKLQFEQNRAESMNEILDSLPIMVWKRNSDLDMTYCNKIYADALDSTPERVMMSNAPLIPGNLFGQGLSLAENAKKCNRAQAISQLTVIKGVRKKLSIHESPASKGNFLGYAIDITAEDNIAASLDKIVTANCEVLENLSTAIAIFGENTRLLFFNSAYQRLTKIEASRLHSKPTLSEILDERRNNRQLPEHADFQAYKKSQLALFTSITSPTQELVHFPNGKTLRLMIAPYPLGGLLFMYEDVTTSLTLQRKNNTLLAVQKETIDHLYEGIAVYGSDNRLKIFNNAARKIWNLENVDDNEIKGMHLSDILDHIKTQIDFGEDWETFRANAISNLTDRILKTGKLMKNDNSVILFSYIPLPDGAHMLSYIDITDTCMVERAILDKNQALKEAQNLRFELIYGISTELNEPLNILIGFAEMLIDQYYGALNEKQIEYSRYILAAANQLHQLVNNLLDMVSIDIDSEKLDMSEFYMEETVKEVILNVEKRAKEKNIDIILSLNTRSNPQEKGFPKKRVENSVENPRGSSSSISNVYDDAEKVICADIASVGEVSDGTPLMTIGSSETLFEGDKLRIKQALFNILLNAIQLTPIKGKVDVRVINDGSYIKVIVKNESVEHEKHDERKAFKHSKNNSTFRSGDSESLSMPLVRKLVELHKGTLSITSNSREGICAVVTLPLIKIYEKTVGETSKTPSTLTVSKEQYDEPIIEFKKVVNS